MDPGWNDCRLVGRQSNEGRWLRDCGRPSSGYSRRRRRRVGLRGLRNLAGWRRDRRNSCGVCRRCDFGLGEPLAEEGLTSESGVYSSTDDTGEPMKKAVAIVVLMLGFMVGCSSYSPDAGHEVVLVEKPYIFGHGGVDSDSVKAGRTFTAISTEGVGVFMQPQKYEMEMSDMMTSDGVPITVHAIVSLQVPDTFRRTKAFGAVG